MNESSPPMLELDVRPLVASRRPPLPAIMHAVSALAAGQALRLIAPFEPAPLYQHMRERGFSHETTRAQDGAWVVVFRR